MPVPRRPTAEAVPAGGRGSRRGGERPGTLPLHDPKAMALHLQGLEKQMLEKARNLEFEEAARLRDQMHQVREQMKRAG